MDGGFILPSSLNRVTASSHPHILIFWAARLPAVAVGLSALLASLVLAPIPAATEPRGGVGISHSAMGVGASQSGRTPCVPTDASSPTDCRWLLHTDINLAVTVPAHPAMGTGGDSAAHCVRGGMVTGRLG